MNSGVTSTVGRKYHGGKQAQATPVKWVSLPWAYLRRDLLAVMQTAQGQPQDL